MNSARLAVYRVRPGATKDLVRHAEERVLPLLRSQPGFLAYELIQVGADEVVSISTWRTLGDGAAAAFAAGEAEQDGVQLVRNWIGEVAFRHLSAGT